MAEIQDDQFRSRMRAYYAGKRVVVAGVTGFLGANCALALREAGAQVVGVARGDARRAEALCDEFVACDLSDAASGFVWAQGASIIFDCIGYSQVTPTDLKPSGNFEAAFRPTINLLANCIEGGAEPLFVHVSSRLVYGAPISLPVNENHPVKPGTLYAANKLLLENYLEVLAKANRLRKIVFRLSSPYGPNAPATPGSLGVWNQLIHKALRGEQLSIYGEGQQLRDFIYIEDVVNAFLAAAAHEACVGHTFNLGGEQAIPLREAIFTIAREAGGPPVRFVPWPPEARKVETGDYCSDISKLKGFVDLPRQTTFEAGVRSTVQALRGEAEAPDPQCVVPFVERHRRREAALGRSLEGQKFLVAGASGFLGAHLIRRLLSDRAHVLAVSRSLGTLKEFQNDDHFSFQARDLSAPEVIEHIYSEMRPDFVIYLAACPDGAETGDLIRERFSTNVMGLVNTLEGCHKHAPEAKFIYGDSRKVYGNAPPPHRAGTRPAPLSSYAFSKEVGWRLCQLYGEMHGLTVLSIRPSLIYGPGQGANVVRNVWEAAKRRENTINLRGGQQTRDPIYVEDAVDAFIAAAQRAQGLANKVIVIGGSEEVTVSELAKLILEVAGSDATISGDAGAMPSRDMVRSHCDLSEAEQLLEWTPRRSLREGLRLTFAVDVAHKNFA